MDRNLNMSLKILILPGSLSARRAWIEIRLADMSAAWNRSLSARRAWIEISGVDFAEDWLNVALRKESVDRNSLLCRILFRR